MFQKCLVLTIVSTIFVLLFLSVFTVWKTSTIFCCWIISLMLQMAQNVPERPPPVLQSKSSEKWKQLLKSIYFGEHNKYYLMSLNNLKHVTYISIINHIVLGSYRVKVRFLRSSDRIECFRLYWWIICIWSVLFGPSKQQIENVSCIQVCCAFSLVSIQTTSHEKQLLTFISLGSEWILSAFILNKTFWFWEVERQLPPKSESMHYLSTTDAFTVHSAGKESQ